MFGKQFLKTFSSVFDCKLRKRMHLLFACLPVCWQLNGKVFLHHWKLQAQRSNLINGCSRSPPFFSPGAKRRSAELDRGQLAGHLALPLFAALSVSTSFSSFPCSPSVCLTFSLPQRATQLPLFPVLWRCMAAEAWLSREAVGVLLLLWGSWGKTGAQSVEKTDAGWLRVFIWKEASPQSKHERFYQLKKEARQWKKHVWV